MKIHCRNLTYRYPGSAENVLDAFELHIDSGITILKGYSGCGKSTLLRLLGGLIEPTAGRIISEGMSQPGSLDFLRREFAMVFQELNLLPLASVWRNIELCCKIAGVDEQEGRNWLERLGMTAYSERRVESLSGGQKQRVAIARSMAKSPKLLLLDEPTSGLDDDNTDIILSAIREFSQKREAICVIATHDHRIDPIANELVDFHRLLPVAQ